MQFASFPFLLFFVIITVSCSLVPKYRVGLLLAGSFFFCFLFSPLFPLLFFAIALFNYFLAISLETHERITKSLFAFGVFFIILILGVFKYTGFLLGGEFIFMVPVGISFLTMQSVSYLIEVNSGRLKAERHLGHLCLYFLFFPKLVSGPIERPNALLSQFKKPWTFDELEAAEGLKRIAWGLFKKLVVADRLAIIVNKVYTSPEIFTGSQLLIATFMFSVQIYFDFAGYTDIALGMAQIFGIRLSENFKQPYFAESVTEFWQRWHISFSSWLRDYVYFPLARKIASSSWRWIAILLTFLISGIWHGAGWTFILWGLLHGIFLVIENTAQSVLNPKVHAAFDNAAGKTIKIITTFAAVSFAWIFFRAETLGDAWVVLSRIPQGAMQLVTTLTNVEHLKEMSIQMGFGLADLIILIGAGTILVISEIIETKISLRDLLAKQKPFVRWAIYYSLATSILFLGLYGGSAFVYFQF